MRFYKNLRKMSEAEFDSFINEEVKNFNKASEFFMFGMMFLGVGYVFWEVINFIGRTIS